MSVVLLAMLLQALPGGRLEARTPSIDRMLDAFRVTWEDARAAVVPGTDAVLEFPEAELYIEQQRAIAYTSFDGLKYLTRADWRARC